MATSTTQKWLIGCGIGCAALIVMAIGLVTGTIFYVRGKFQPIQEASETRREIVSAHGAPDAYAPPPDGAIAPARLEAFLSVRASLKEAQKRVDTALEGIDLEQFSRKRHSFGEAFRMLNGVSNLIAPVADYVTRRNRELVAKQMGLGEYAYIYTIAYHSWLGYRPDEGPQILEEILLRDPDKGFRDESGLGSESVRRQYRRITLRLLSNQLAGIKETEQTKWHAILAEEIHRMEEDPNRVAWQDNLPQQIEGSLKPHRSGLEEAYHRTTNYFELLTIDDFNQFQRNEQPGTRRPS